jgi:hypothetical protein
MPYTLNFSDPGNLNTITVPDYPPGLNAVDTSLSFVGKGYPNYGQVVDQNFLKVLENFAGPINPTSPIKGQLWYDSFSRSLKLFDGNTWKSANGIYQQPTDPAIESPVSYGDIWVDTANTLLKIRGAGSWVQVGPSDGAGTGISVQVLQDVATTNDRTVLFVKVNGQVVAVFSNNDTFIPSTYPSEMQGFTDVVKGITLPDLSTNNYSIKGTVDNSLKLNGVAGESYLRKDDSSVGGQIITGKVVFVTPSLSGQENRDGVIIRTSGENPALNYIQFFKKDNDAIISNEVKAGRVIVKIKGLNDSSQTSALTIEKNQTTIIGNLTVTSGVLAASTITGTLTTAAQPIITSVGTLTNLSVSGLVNVSGTVSAGNFSTTGAVYADDLYVTGRAVIQGIYSTGTIQLWVGSTATISIPDGWLACDGSQKSISAYPGLFGVIGDKYGISGGGNFYLPNMVMTSPLPPGDPRGATTATYYIIKQD